MHLTSKLTMIFAVLWISTACYASGPEVGKIAPDFVGYDTQGNSIQLSELFGKPIVLEWTNHECPYVKKHYNSGNMQRTQRLITEQGAIWISVISSAKGEQGYVSGQEAEQLTQSRGAYASMVLLDPEGVIGKLYGAKTTPQMFLIDETGTVRYMGAIDDKPSARPSSLKGATNFVTNAWHALKSGQQVSPSVTKPYGCSVKYAH